MVLEALECHMTPGRSRREGKKIGAENRKEISDIPSPHRWIVFLFGKIQIFVLMGYLWERKKLSRDIEIVSKRKGSGDILDNGVRNSKTENNYYVRFR